MDNCTNITAILAEFYGCSMGFHSTFSISRRKQALFPVFHSFFSTKRRGTSPPAFSSFSLHFHRRSGALLSKMEVLCFFLLSAVRKSREDKKKTPIL